VVLHQAVHGQGDHADDDQGDEDGLDDRASRLATAATAAAEVYPGIIVEMR
jgi:hypothetical protein